MRQYGGNWATALWTFTPGAEAKLAAIKRLFSLLYKYLPDIESRTVREGEFACNAMIGFNFGDAHMHGPYLMPSIQKRVNYVPGEFIFAYVESQPINRQTQKWMLVDAAVGVLAEGEWSVAEMVSLPPPCSRAPASR